jgi:hypothetical protein
MFCIITKEKKSCCQAIFPKGVGLTTMPHGKLRGAETDDLNAGGAAVDGRTGRHSVHDDDGLGTRTGRWIALEHLISRPGSSTIELAMWTSAFIDFLFFHPFSSFLLFCIYSGYQTEVSKFKPLQAVELKKKASVKLFLCCMNVQNTETRYAQLLQISRYKAITHERCTIIANY